MLEYFLSNVIVIVLASSGHYAPHIYIHIVHYVTADKSTVRNHRRFYHFPLQASINFSNLFRNSLTIMYVESLYKAMHRTSC